MMIKSYQTQLFELFVISMHELYGLLDLAYTLIHLLDGVLAGDIELISYYLDILLLPAASPSSPRACPSPLNSRAAIFTMALIVVLGCDDFGDF